MDVPILGQQVAPPEPEGVGPQIRLLICLDCKSIEELPDFVGPAEYDTLLEISVEKHRDGLGIEHRGHLMKVPLKFWVNDYVRKEILDNIRRGSAGLADIDPAFYDLRNTFRDDALQCYEKHLRPKGQCPDWMSDSKILRPNLRAERKELGLAPKSPVKSHLCAHCPVSIYNRNKANDARGV